MGHLAGYAFVHEGPFELVADGVHGVEDGGRSVGIQERHEDREHHDPDGVDRAAPTVAASQEQQAYGKNGEPDKTTGHDHANDAIGYHVFFTMPVIKHVFKSSALML